MNDVDTIDGVVLRAARRKHSAELKAQVLDACSQPDASVAAIARLHNLNANVVHRWRADQRKAVALQMTSETALAPPPGFIAVNVQSQAAAPVLDIRIELQRGNATAVVHWPVQSAASCTAWLREWLR